MTKTILKAALLPSLAMLAACSATPSSPTVAPLPEEAFRPVCQERFPQGTPFAINKCMYDELDKSRGITPASAATAPAPEPAPAPARSPARRSR
ncbi:hypothetical protein [Roseomonas xinghualingensis]|uniref:hypothetical protein n=1 Tax=Roseomonas xinghualingensis TaxID=2986475 RepID=UPI0021F164EC|nr:hypothetical protein [Roseomonas sp. SXEYE001]MCV4205934.1 hypothetical protein [Roseomonas sp. SXEYE001]